MRRFEDWLFTLVRSFRRVCAGLLAAVPAARGESVLHVRRLASEMREVIGTIEEDLQALGADSTTLPLRLLCVRYRSDIDAILARTDALPPCVTIGVHAMLEKLRDEHRRVVNLRSDVDRMLLVRRGGHAARWARGDSRSTSSSGSSGFTTSPSTRT